MGLRTGAAEGVGLNAICYKTPPFATVRPHDMGR